TERERADHVERANPRQRRGRDQALLDGRFERTADGRAEALPQRGPGHRGRRPRASRPPRIAPPPEQARITPQARAPPRYWSARTGPRTRYGPQVTRLNSANWTV